MSGIRPVSTDTLRPYQLDFYRALMGLEEEKGTFHTLMAIPTGGGKTRLAVTYAVNRVLAGGRKVLWLAHSRYLLDQAMGEFRACLRRGGMSGEEIRREEENFILVHSGEGGRGSGAISPRHRLVVCSFQSLLKNPAALERVGEAVVFIDEAHHTVAQGCFRLLRDYARDKTVIGLTATPIRTGEGETSELLAFYRDSLPCRVHLSTLLRGGAWLVPPVFETVPAPEGEELERLAARCRSDGGAQARRLLDRQMLELYRRDRKKYGKTVIAAADRGHVEELYALFRRELGPEGVFRVYSGLEDREEQFRAFRAAAEGVLLNVNIMNEGVDIPDIQSVFLARPIESRIVMTQIVGRALRQVPEGREPKKRCAYIVNFAASDPERKVLFVMPGLTYAMYEARWNEDEGEVRKLVQRERSLRAAGELTAAVRARRAVSTLSAACLAGYYAVAPDDRQELVVPVSVRDFRRLERFRAAARGGGRAGFPRRLTFYDGDMGQLEEAFTAALAGGGTAEFFPYDEALLRQLEDLTGLARELCRRARAENWRQSRVIREIRSTYARQVPGEVRTYLEQTGIDGELYTKLLYTELAEIRAEEREMVQI